MGRGCTAMIRRGMRRIQSSVWAGLVVVLALSPVAWRLVFARGSTTPRAADEVVLSYMAWGNPQQLDVERALIRRFNDDCKARGQRVRVQLMMPPAGGYLQKLQ